MVHCRICHRGSLPDEPLLRLCRCRGSLGKSHESCIKSWVLAKTATSCEVCGERYRFSLDVSAVPPSSSASASLWNRVLTIARHLRATACRAFLLPIIAFLQLSSVLFLGTLMFQSEWFVLLFDNVLTIGTIRPRNVFLSIWSAFHQHHPLGAFLANWTVLTWLGASLLLYTHLVGIAVLLLQWFTWCTLHNHDVFGFLEIDVPEDAQFVAAAVEDLSDSDAEEDAHDHNTVETKARDGPAPQRREDEDEEKEEPEKPNDAAAERTPLMEDDEGPLRSKRQTTAATAATVAEQEPASSSGTAAAPLPPPLNVVPQHDMVEVLRQVRANRRDDDGGVNGGPNHTPSFVSNLLQELGITGPVTNMLVSSIFLGCVMVGLLLLLWLPWRIGILVCDELLPSLVFPLLGDHALAFVAIVRSQMSHSGEDDGGGGDDVARLLLRWDAARFLEPSTAVRLLPDASLWSETNNSAGTPPLKHFHLYWIVGFVLTTRLMSMIAPLRSPQQRQREQGGPLPNPSSMVRVVHYIVLLLRCAELVVLGALFCLALFVVVPPILREVASLKGPAILRMVPPTCVLPSSFNTLSSEWIACSSATKATDTGGTLSTFFADHVVPLSRSTTTNLVIHAVWLLSGHWEVASQIFSSNYAIASVIAVLTFDMVQVIDSVLESDDALGLRWRWKTLSTFLLRAAVSVILLISLAVVPCLYLGNWLVDWQLTFDEAGGFELLVRDAGFYHFSSSRVEYALLGPAVRKLASRLRVHHVVYFFQRPSANDFSLPLRLAVFVTLVWCIAFVTMLLPYCVVGAAYHTQHEYVPSAAARHYFPERQLGSATFHFPLALVIFSRKSFWFVVFLMGIPLQAAFFAVRDWHASFLKLKLWWLVVPVQDLLGERGQLTWRVMEDVNLRTVSPVIVLSKFDVDAGIVARLPMALQEKVAPRAAPAFSAALSLEDVRAIRTALHQPMKSFREFAFVFLTTVMGTVVGRLFLGLVILETLSESAGDCSGVGGFLESFDITIWHALYIVFAWIFGSVTWGLQCEAHRLFLSKAAAQLLVAARRGRYAPAEVSILREILAPTVWLSSSVIVPMLLLSCGGKWWLLSLGWFAAMKWYDPFAEPPAQQEVVPRVGTLPAVDGSAPAPARDFRILPFPE